MNGQFDHNLAARRAPLMSVVSEIEQDVRDERQRQIARWGVQTHANGTNFNKWYPHTVDARNAWERARETGSETWLQILNEEVLEVFEKDENDLVGIREELVQVIAVAVAWLENIDGTVDAQLDRYADESAGAYE